MVGFMLSTHSKSKSVYPEIRVCVRDQIKMLLFFAHGLAHSLEPSELYSPLAQRSHSAWPSLAVKRPARQETHASDPVEFVALPLVQFEQLAAPPPEILPLAHSRQSARARTGAFFPGVHASQLVLPTTDAYFPVWHSKQEAWPVAPW